MKCIITGGAGFIGARLVGKLLSENFEVHVLDVIPIEKAYRLKEYSSNSNLIYVLMPMRV